MDLQQSLVLISIWPASTITWELHRWLIDLGFDAEQQMPIYHAGMDASRNFAVQVALRSPKRFQHFLFVDGDVRPTPQTRLWLDPPEDVVGCRYDLGGPEPWAWEKAIHTSIWRCRRHVLETLAPPQGAPLFRTQVNADGSQEIYCQCLGFVERCLAAGFSVCHAGWAEHDRPSRKLQAQFHARVASGPPLQVPPHLPAKG